MEGRLTYVVLEVAVHGHANELDRSVSYIGILQSSSMRMLHTLISSVSPFK